MLIGTPCFSGSSYGFCGLCKSGKHFSVTWKYCQRESKSELHQAGLFHGFQLSNVSVTFVPLLCFYISLIYSLFFISFFIFPNSFIHSGEPHRKKSNKISIEPAIKLFRTKEFQSMQFAHQRKSNTILFYEFDARAKSKEYNTKQTIIIMQNRTMNWKLSQLWESNKPGKSEERWNRKDYMLCFRKLSREDREMN